MHHLLRALQALRACSLAHPCRVASLRVTVSGVGGWERKTYGQGTGLFCGVSPSPRSPRGSFRSASLHHCRCCCAQEAQHASLLSFCTSFSQLSRYGLATPSSHDGCCAGAPICRQPVLRTLCFTNRWNHHLSSVFIYLTNSPFGLHVYHLHWVSSLGR